MKRVIGGDHRLSLSTGDSQARLPRRSTRRHLKRLFIERHFVATTFEAGHIVHLHDSDLIVRAESYIYFADLRLLLRRRRW